MCNKSKNRTQTERRGCHYPTQTGKRLIRFSRALFHTTPAAIDTPFHCSITNSQRRPLRELVDGKFNAPSPAPGNELVNDIRPQRTIRGECSGRSPPKYSRDRNVTPLACETPVRKLSREGDTLYIASQRCIYIRGRVG